MKHLLFLSSLFIFSSCEMILQDSNYLYSKDYPNQEKRIEILKQEIKFPTDFSDCEFELFNVNQFNSNSRTTSVPSASSFEYKFCIKIDRDNIPLWLDSYEEITGEVANTEWIKKISEDRINNWNINSPLKIFKRPNEEAYLYLNEKNGEIWKWVRKL